MKKYLTPIILLIFLAVTSCEDKIDVEKEKEAIKAVIENETNSFKERNFEQQSKSFLQDENLTILGVGKFNLFQFYGWENVSTMYKSYYNDEPDPVTNAYQYTNYKIKIYDKSALAVYDEIEQDSEGKFLRKNISTRFLEKTNDGWKIVYLSWIEATPYGQE